MRYIPYRTCVKAWETADLSSCKPLGFDLISWIAIIGAVFAVVVFLTKASSAESTKTSATTAKIKWRPWRRRFPLLCRLIAGPMVDNSRIFQEFGPNSGRGEELDRIVRNDVSVWKELLPVLAENNRRIGDLIRENRNTIPTRYASLFQRWTNHIDAFAAHANDPAVDYRSHQFPVDVVEVISRHA